MTSLEKKPKPKFDKNKAEKTLVQENGFIRNLYSILSLPTPAFISNEIEQNKSPKKALPMKTSLKPKTTRAKSLVDLQERIDKLKAKPDMNYKEKLQKKNLKSKLKKKIKKEIYNNQPKIKKETKLTEEENPATKSPNESKILFSKFNFEGLGKQKKKTKVEKDPKKMLEKVKEVKQKVDQLKSLGAVDKAIEIREKTAWKNALAKAEGVKVKDDPLLLKKSIKKIEQRKRSSKKKWDARQENVKKQQEERQKKRTENIAKRQKEKKVTKLKKAAKKGKIIPGF